MEATGARTRRRRAPWARAAAGVTVAVVAVRLLVLTPVAVDGTSMAPTVQDGDIVMVWRPGTTATELRRGDLVVFRDPAGTLTLKRVLALPGEHVAMLDAVLTVDGVPVDEPYVDHSQIDGTYLPQVLVPPGSVYVLGDDRVHSVDSRHHGAVPDTDLVGRVVLHVGVPRP